MVALTGFILQIIPQWTRDHLNMVPLDRLGGHLYEDRQTSDTATGYCGLMTKTAPVETTSRTISGYNVSTYKEDFYYRVHVKPNRIDVGNMLSAQTHEIEVWNAWPSDHVLSSIPSTGTDGMSLASAASPPKTFGPLEVADYTLSIATNGAPIIDAEYRFNFARETPTLKVVGRRVLIWPFMPQTAHREILEWRTDVIPSFGSEQRIALRQAPRQSLGYSFQLDPQQFSRAKAIATQWAHRTYGVPVWAELTRVGVLLQGASEIMLDTANLDYRVGGVVMVWESDLKNVAAECVGILPDRLRLKLPLEESYGNAYVAPLRFALTPGGMSFKRANTDITVADALFDVTENADLSAVSEFPKYRGRDVLSDPTVLVGELSERISRSTDVFDNGSGVVVLEVQNNWVNSAKALTFDTATRAARWAARSWLHARRGKQKSFWIPSWNLDLILIEDAPTGSATLTVRNIGYATYYGQTDIMVRRTDGTMVFARVMSGSVDAFGNDRLNLSAALLEDVLISSVDVICFMSHVRLNSDRAEIRHLNAGRATISIPLLETPE